MSRSPTIDETPAEKVPDGEAAKKIAEDIEKHLTTLGGEHLKTLLRAQSGQASKDGGHPPEIPPEEECWQAFDDIAAKHIPETAEMLRKQLDNVLLFATLFSAINSAFLIYTLPTATTSTQDPTNQLLLYVIRGLNNESADDATNFLAAAESSGHTVNLIVNAVFSISFVLSIIGTLIAVLGQTWVTNYGRDIAVDPKELREERRQKLVGADRWYFQPVLEIVLPVILQAALIVFCGGFIVLLWSMNTTLAIAVLPFLAVGFLTIGASIGFAVWDSGCPYQTPISSRIIPGFLSGSCWLLTWVLIIVFVLGWGLNLVAVSLFNWIYCGSRRWQPWITWRELWLAIRKAPERAAEAYGDISRDFANKLKRPGGSIGTQHAELVAWSLSNSSDPVAVSKVISALLHGKKMDGICNDVYLHPVFEQLLSRAGRSTYDGGPVCKASSRAMRHVFLASFVEPLRNVEDLGYGTKLYRVIDANGGDPGRFDEFLELAIGFKLLGFSASNIPEEMAIDQLGTLLPIPGFLAILLDRMTRVVGALVANEALAFRDLHYLGKFIGTLMPEAAGTEYPDILFLYNEFRRDYESIWNHGSSPPLRKTYCIPLGRMVQMASASVGSGPAILPAVFGKLFTTILYNLDRPDFRGEVIGSDFIHEQLRELNLLLKKLPVGEDEVWFRSFTNLIWGNQPGYLTVVNMSSRVLDIQTITLSLAKKLVEAGTSRPISTDNNWSAEDGAGVGRSLLQLVDLLPEKDEARYITLKYLRFLSESSFSSLDWDSFGESIQSMFGLSQMLTGLGKSDQGTERFNSETLGNLRAMAVGIKLKTVEMISEERAETVVRSTTRIELKAGTRSQRQRRGRYIPPPTYCSPAERIRSLDIITHLTDFLREANVKDLTDQQWSGLVNIESSLKSFKPPYHPSDAVYNQVYDLPSEGAAYLKEMNISRDKREQSTATIEDGQAPPSDHQDVTVVYDSGGRFEDQSLTNHFGTRMGPVRDEGEAPLQEPGRAEEPMKLETETPLQDEGGVEDTLDSPN